MHVVPDPTKVSKTKLPPQKYKVELDDKVALVEKERDALLY